jgi:hypothetical protein
MLYRMHLLFTVELSHSVRTEEVTVLLYFKVLCRFSSGELAGNHENLSQDSRYSGRDSKRALSEFNSEALPLTSTCSVKCKELKPVNGCEKCRC